MNVKGFKFRFLGSPRIDIGRMFLFVGHLFLFLLWIWYVFPIIAPLKVHATSFHASPLSFYRKNAAGAS